MFFYVALPIVGLTLGIVAAEWWQFRGARAFVERPSAAVRRGPIAVDLAAYFVAFQRAKADGNLDDFDVEAEIRAAGRRARRAGSLSRAAAGALILVGLLVTLLQLGGAVAHLGDAFTQLATQQINGGSTDTRVMEVMPEIANAARAAFRTSFICILFALLLIIVSYLTAAAAATIGAEFEAAARARYRDARRDIPGASSLADKFGGAATALDNLVRHFGAVTQALGSIGLFADKMDQARAAIVNAMQGLPANISAGVERLNERFVTQIAAGLTEANESSKQILLIYGHQLQRIDRIQEEIVAVRNATAQIAALADLLRGVPTAVVAMAEAANKESLILDRLDTSVSEFAIRVEELPVGELRKSTEDLSESAAGILGGVQAVATFAAQVAKVAALRRDIPDVLASLKEQSAATVSGMQAMRTTIAELPVTGLRDASVTLAEAALRLGNLHAQTLAALAEIVRNSEEFKKLGNDLRSAVQSVLRHSEALAVERAKVPAGDPAMVARKLTALENAGIRLLKHLNGIRENPRLDFARDQLDSVGQELNAILADISGQLAGAAGGAE